MHMPLDDLKERARAIDIAVGQIEKQFGKGSIMRLGQRGAIARWRRSPPAPSASTMRSASAGYRAAASSRSSALNRPGKTTLALQVIAEAQKTGGMAAFVDAEHALDAQYAQKLGVDLENLLSRSPITASRRSKSSKCSFAPTASTSS
jgi:recombination protein RecA